MRDERTERGSEDLRWASQECWRLFVSRLAESLGDVESIRWRHRSSPSMGTQPKRDNIAESYLNLVVMCL